MASIASERQKVWQLNFTATRTAAARSQAPSLARATRTPPPPSFPDLSRRVNHLFADTSEAMTRFRPCIDLHNGDVKQIVGGTLGTSEAELKTNFTSTKPSAHYAELYHKYHLGGAHIIMLGPNNEKAAQDALAAWKEEERKADAADAEDKWKGEIQVGGGIKESNAREWIEYGADKVGKLVDL